LAGDAKDLELHEAFDFPNLGLNKFLHELLPCEKQERLAFSPHPAERGELLTLRKVFGADLI
jgi:hypothetical protein